MFSLVATIYVLSVVSLAKSADVVAGYGFAISIPCDYGAPESQVFAVSWKHDGVDVVTYGAGVAHFQGSYENRATFNDVNFALTLNDITFNDEGIYECSVTTSAGSPASQINLQVLASPKVNAQAFDVLDDGTNQAATLAECIVTGASKPYSVKWVTDMNDEVVPNNFRVETDNPTFAELVDATLPLTIRPDPERNNGRTFSCVIEDALGNMTSVDVVLSVSVPTTTPQTTTPQASPHVVTFPTSNDDALVSMVIGSQKQFECKIGGVPAPSVSWYREDQLIVTNVGEAVLTVLVNSFDDATRYQCTGTNKAGQISKTFKIDVQGPPEIETSGEFKNETEKILPSPETTNIELVCEAKAKPAAAIVWNIEGLNETDLVVVEESRGLVVRSIVNITSSGMDKKPILVKCIASNVHGDASRIFSIEYPMAEANTALVVGVVMAVIVLLALVFFIVFFSLTRRQHKDVDVTKPNEVESGNGMCTPGCFAFFPCGNSTSPNEETQEDVDGNQVKEVNEEGTSEEKQKLTEAEEKPAAENVEKEEGNGETGEGAESVGEEKKSRKMQIPFPTQCCRGNKQELEEESCDGEEEGKKENEENGQGSQQNSGTKKDQAVDKDSGKGDTLEKVAEETNETK